VTAIASVHSEGGKVSFEVFNGFTVDEEGIGMLVGVLIETFGVVNEVEDFHVHYCLLE